jgi:hypothetical protein
MMRDSPISPAPSSLYRELAKAHAGLLQIHKVLIDNERKRYERDHARVSGPGEMFQLLVNDPFFAWLRVMSELIVSIDEWLSSEEPIDAAAGEALLAQTHDLLTPSDAGNDFQREYARAIQESPEVAMTHGACKLSFRKPLPRTE